MSDVIGYPCHWYCSTRPTTQQSHKQGLKRTTVLEVSFLLDLIVQSLYNHKEASLRELLSQTTILVLTMVRLFYSVIPLWLLKRLWCLQKAAVVRLMFNNVKW